MQQNNILQEINQNRLQQVQQQKKTQSIEIFKDATPYHNPCISLVKSIASKKNAIISEFKKASPSKGIINNSVLVQEVTKGYQNAGAAGISILTEATYFKGSNNDLIEARPNITIPILRKDFIVDEYQITETKALGADVLLLIAASLTINQVKDYSAYAKAIGLEVILEIHDETELLHICDDIDIVGVNNRSLKTFEVNINTSIKLFPFIPTQKIAISESGLTTVENIQTLQKVGFDGFLMGEAFMKYDEPHEQLKKLLAQL